MASFVIMEERQQKYLEALESEICAGLETVACKIAGVAFGTVWRWKKLNPEFAKMAEQSRIAGRQHAVRIIEHSLFTKAASGNIEAIKFALEKWDKENYSPKPLFSIEQKNIVLSDPQAVETLLKAFMEVAQSLPKKQTTENEQEEEIIEGTTT